MGCTNSPCVVKCSCLCCADVRAQGPETHLRAGLSPPHPSLHRDINSSVLPCPCKSCLGAFLHLLHPWTGAGFQAPKQKWFLLVASMGSAQPSGKSAPSCAQKKEITLLGTCMLAQARQYPESPVI